MAVAVVEDPGFGMIQGTVSPRMVRAPGTVQGQRDAHFEESGPHHPCQGPEPLPRNLVLLRAPARREAKSDALLLRGRKVMHQAAVQAGVKRFHATLVGGNFLRTPG